MRPKEISQTAAKPVIPKPRRKKPWKPGDAIPEDIRSELGLPEVKPDRRIRSKLPEVPEQFRGARDLFADPGQREAQIEYAFQLMRAQGKFDVLRSDIHIAQTSMDRNFTQGEYEAVCWFSKFHAIVTGGRYAAEMAGSADACAEYAHVLERLPESYQVIMDWVAAVKYPQCFINLDETLPTKVQMARQMFAAADEHYLRGGIDGFFKAVCQLLAHLRAERQTRLNRRELVRKEYIRNRRLANGENG